jgi:hypothetical protein
MNDFQKFRRIGASILRTFPNIKAVTLSLKRNDNNYREYEQFIDFWKTERVYYQNGCFSSVFNCYRSYHNRFKQKLICSLPISFFNIEKFTLVDNDLADFVIARNEVSAYQGDVLVINNANDLKAHLTAIKNVFNTQKIELIGNSKWIVNGHFLDIRGNGLKTKFRGELNFN